MIKSKKYKGIYLHKLANGDITFYIQYIDEDKKNCKIKVGRRSEGIDENYCFHKRNELINQIRLGENPKLIQKKGPSFDEVAQKYFINLINEGRSANATMISTQSYNKHIVKYIKDKSIYSITAELLNKLKNDKIKTLAPKTVNNQLELISSIINFGKKHLDLQLKNHLSDGKVKKFKLDNNRERFLNKEEIKLLLENVAQNEKLNLAIRLALSTGARLQTLLSIQKKNVDKVNRLVILKDHKNNSTYTSFLPECYFDNFDFLNGLKANDYIISDNGTMLNRSTIQQSFKRVADRLFNIGLASDDRKNRLVFHSLRHTFCSLLAINNVPIFTIQKLVNHRDIKSTIRYSKLDSSSMFNAVENAFAS